ncbi:MAG: BatA and WFA domain-containing protein [Acidobacteriota bacterium]
MRFLSTIALWWLALSGIIIFFYLLKLRRKRRIVPSVLLWQRALEELEANAPFRKLRRSLLLLLQLLALAAMVFALARPLISTRSLAAGSTVIIIDSTASMSARDEAGRTRLERAKELAREMIEGLSDDDRAAIIESSSRVTVRSSLTTDSAALRLAINDITETDAAGNLADALQLAEQIAKTERDASIVIISDGGGSIAEATAQQKSTGVAVRFVRVGERGENIGIVAMNWRATQGSMQRELFASIANFSDRDQSAGLELRIDGNLIDAREVVVGRNDRAALIFDSLPQMGGLAELRLAASDDLASDNIAYACLPDARRLRVGLASENPFLIRALAVNTEIDARRIDSGSSLEDLDCIVSEDSLRPDAVDSRKPLLAINPPDSRFWQIASTRERPEVTSFDRSHPVNAYLSYGDLHIESISVRTLAPWLKPVASAGGDALISAGEDAGRRVVMIAIDPAKSDLPLKVEFPILIANAINWLAGREHSEDDRAIRAGQTVTLRAIAPVVITTPDGDEREATSSEGETVFADTLRVGLYKVKDSQPFAVSLLSESESDTAPRDSIHTRAGEVSGEAETFHSEREVWRWVAMFAIALLAFEWWVYHRRIAS